MVQFVNFGSNTSVINSRLVLEVSEFEDFNGGFFDFNMNMAKSCIVVQSIDGGTANIYSLPNGNAYATLGEIKIIHNMSSVYDIILKHQWNSSDGDIITSDSQDFILSPYCSVMLQFIYFADAGHNVWKVVACPSLISS